MINKEKNNNNGANGLFQSELLQSKSVLPAFVVIIFFDDKKLITFNKKINYN